MKDQVLKASALLCAVVLILAGIMVGFGNQRNTENYVEKAVSYYKPQGAEVVLIKDGQVAQVLNYGDANVAKKEKVTKDTQFKIASISKVFTAYAIMKLVDEGTLNLDVPVNTYLRQWQVPDSEYGAEKVTLRTLLCHTSGLSGSDALGYTGDNPGVAKTLAADDVHLLREPGTEFVYLEATGMGVCQLVIEETTGQSFADYMQMAVFDKLGMTKTSYADESETLATPYAGLNSPVAVTHYVMTGASGVTSTGEDMATFALALMRYQQSGSEMFTPQDMAGGAWCLGIEPTQLSSGQMVYSHNGTLTGWNAQLVIDPATQDGLIVLSNSDKAYYMTYQIMADWGKYVLANPIQNDNGASMAQMIQMVVLGLNGFLLLGLVSNYWRWIKGRLVEKERGRRRAARMISDVLMGIGVTLYIVLFYTPVIFNWLYQMPNYYLFTFFPPIIHWVLAEIIVFALMVVWRSGYRRCRREGVVS